MLQHFPYTPLNTHTHKHIHTHTYTHTQAHTHTLIHKSTPTETLSTPVILQHTHYTAPASTRPPGLANSLPAVSAQPRLASCKRCSLPVPLLHTGKPPCQHPGMQGASLSTLSGQPQACKDLQQTSYSLGSLPAASARFLQPSLGLGLLPVALPAYHPSHNPPILPRLPLYIQPTHTPFKTHQTCLSLG